MCRKAPSLPDATSGALNVSEITGCFLAEDRGDAAGRAGDKMTFSPACSGFRLYSNSSLDSPTALK